MAEPTLPNTWVIQDGRTITRPEGMSDALWMDTLESGGWTPGATGSGTAPGATPEQIMGMIMAALQGGAAVFSSVHGAVTAANAQTGMVTLANGMTVPIASLSTLNLGGTATTPPITVDTQKPPATQGFELSPTVLLAVGGLGLILLVALRR